MSSIYLKPRTAANPDAISPEGAAVQFAVRAKCRPDGQRGRFRFRLDSGDGFTWDNGSTMIDEFRDLTGTWTTYDFDRTLRSTAPHTTVLLRIEIIGRIVDGAGQPVPGGADKRSLAFLTVGPGFSAVLTQHRDQQNLTQAQLGKRVSVSEGWISELENGARPSEELFLGLKKEIES